MTKKIGSRELSAIGAPSSAERRLQTVLISDVEHLTPSSRRFAGECEPSGLVEESDAEGGRFCRLRAGIGPGHDVIGFGRDRARDVGP